MVRNSANLGSANLTSATAKIKIQGSQVLWTTKACMVSAVQVWAEKEELQDMTAQMISSIEP
jgi:hypothetical protein